VVKAPGALLHRGIPLNRFNGTGFVELVQRSSLSRFNELLSAKAGSSASTKRPAGGDLGLGEPGLKPLTACDLAALSTRLLNFAQSRQKVNFSNQKVKEKDKNYSSVL
jgi:hypothetical protein